MIQVGLLQFCFMATVCDISFIIVRPQDRYFLKSSVISDLGLSLYFASFSK